VDERVDDPVLDRNVSIVSVKSGLLEGSSCHAAAGYPTRLESPKRR
jgi:hypothetical protein